MKSYAKHFPKVSNFDEYFRQAAEFAELNTPERRALFLANIAHESAFLTKLEENMNYSAKRLAQVWPKRFSRGGIASKEPNAKAREIANQPKLIAEAVYGGRMGNGPEGSGDGWKYRGRGAIMLTGADNYRKIGTDLGVRSIFVENPDVVSDPEYALLSAAAWWLRNDINGFADKLPDEKSDLIWWDDTDIMEQARKRVNGGTLGLAEVKKLFKMFME